MAERHIIWLMTQALSDVPTFWRLGSKKQKAYHAVDHKTITHDRRRALNDWLVVPGSRRWARRGN